PFRRRLDFDCYRALNRISRFAYHVHENARAGAVTELGGVASVVEIVAGGDAGSAAPVDSPCLLGALFELQRRAGFIASGKLLYVAPGVMNVVVAWRPGGHRHVYCRHAGRVKV